MIKIAAFGGSVMFTGRSTVQIATSTLYISGVSAIGTGNIIFVTL